MGPAKERYAAFCARTYVPIYSKPWWMDAVCGPESWDVWLFEQGGEVAAAMPYYLEERERGLYVTKAPLTQTNGIVFKYPEGAKPLARAKFEERVVNAACAHIASLRLAVYEQQYHPSFTNWLPFSWHGYEALPRYTYVIEDTSDIGSVWEGVSAKQRSCVKKGLRNAASIAELCSGEFYEVHRSVFLRQGKECPFSKHTWERLEAACSSRGRCRAIGARDSSGALASLIFLVWDEGSLYHLLGGSMPGMQGLDTYAALEWKGIELASGMGLSYDFEGSMIKRIAKSFREFGGSPKPYFRIRKVFDPEVVRAEAEERIERMSPDGV